MYMPYLMCGYAATALLLLLGCRVSARTIPGLRGVRLLSWALICALLAVLLLALRPYAPAWATILLANGSLFTCILLFYCATADILTVPMRFLPWGAGLAVAATAGDAWFTYAHDDLTARIFIACGTGAAFAAVMATLYAKRLSAEKQLPGTTTLRSLTALLASLQVLEVVLQAARALLTVLYPPSEILHMDMIQAGFTYFNMLLNAGTGCGLIWLAVCLHRRDLQLLAQTDSLTGLLNRRAFEENLTRAMRRAAHTGKSSAVLLLDIDRFKEVNDSLGHHAGDEVLQRVGAALREGMRPADALARYGGEEFVMLLYDASEAQAEEIAWRLRAEIADLRDLPGETTVTVSIGVAVSQPGDTVEHLLRRCDDALYRSKRAGRNLVTVDRLHPVWPPVASRAY
jgi:diguanylate cyclase (GGDEF)-like protein